MRRLLSIVFVLVSVITFVSEACAQQGRATTRDITVVNEKNQKAYLAYNALDSTTVNNGGWSEVTSKYTTSGWTVIEPGKTVTVKAQTGAWGHYWFRVESGGKEITYNTESKYFWYHDKRFETNGDSGVASQSEKPSMPSGKSFFYFDKEGVGLGMMAKNAEQAKQQGWKLGRFYKGHDGRILVR